MSQIQEWIDAPEFELLRAEINLKDNVTIISCACVCRIHNFSVEDEARCNESCTQIWVCGYRHDQVQTDLKPKVEVFIFKDGNTEQYYFDMVSLNGDHNAVPNGLQILCIHTCVHKHLHSPILVRLQLSVLFARIGSG